MIHPVPPSSSKRLMPFNKFTPYLTLIAALLGFVVLISGCAVKQLPLPPEPSPEVVRFLGQVAQASQTHTALKGIGHFKVIAEGKTISGRMAWAAERPDKLRLTILDPAGRPAALMVTDGNKVWLDLRSEKKQYIKSARRFSLKRLVGIDVTLEDVIMILLGGIPAVGSYHTVEMRHSETAKTAHFLSIKGGLVTVINYQTSPFFITQADYFDRNEALLVGLVRRLGAEMESAQFPKEFDFQDQDRNRLYLRVDRYWVDPEFRSDLFQLEHLQPSPPEDLKER